jgi:hypothetical protein
MKPKRNETKAERKDVPNGVCKLCSICHSCSVRRTLALARVASVGSNVVTAEKCARFCTGHAESVSARVPTGQCLGISHASAQSSATTASATISSGRDGSAASAAASSVQPSVAVSAGRRRSRASITAMTTSSRCKPPPQHQWRPWPRSCARVLWGDHGFMPESASWRGGACTISAYQKHSPRWAHAVPHSGGARVRHSAAGVCRTKRAARAACAAHRQ